MLAERRASLVLSVLETCYVLEKGKIVFRRASKELTDNNAVSEEFLGPKDTGLSPHGLASPRSPFAVRVDRG